MPTIPARAGNTTAKHIPASLERCDRNTCCPRSGGVAKKGSNGFGFDMGEKWAKG